MRAFVAARTAIVVDEDHGGRIVSASFGGHNLLHTQPPGDPLAGGAYPMVPWAGRIRAGRFRFDGVEYQLPLGLPPHAIHGTGFVRAWQWQEDGSLSTELGSDWPFGGWVEQRFHIEEDRYTVTMTVHAAQKMPAMVGWHPWFRRTIGGAQAELLVAPSKMYAVDAEAIPTGALVDVSPRPWDNCFVGLAANPILRWPGLGEVELSSSLDHWVIYDEPEHAICVEPQSGAPDEFNRRPQVITPQAPLVASYSVVFRHG